MVKKFDATCDFGGQKVPVTFYIGTPAVGSHPLNFQSKWLSQARGGVVPSDIMESFGELVEIAERNRVPLEDLCAYVIEELKAGKTLSMDAKRAKELSQPVSPSDKK
jgi:hypothetical protein